MDDRIVLDASAVLAMIQQEPGGAAVAELLGRAVISSVNLAEVGSRVIDGGVDAQVAKRMLDDFYLEVPDFDAEMAHASAALRAETRFLGLSLGDRACLALGKTLGLPVLTADRAWGKLDIGVEVQLLR